MISSGINLVMTVIGFAVSTMFIVFVCTRLICARIQLNASRRSFAVSSRSDLGVLERGLHGLEPLVIANFPTKKYSDDAFFSYSDDSQCTVCLAEYNNEDLLRILPYCGHFFHTTCIDKWLQQHSTCPVCRISLRVVPEKKRMQPMFSAAVRSHYGVIESVDTNSYQCFSASSDLSLREHGDHTIEPIEENQFAPENHLGEAGESVSCSLMEGSDQGAKASGNKHVDSPSSA